MHKFEASKSKGTEAKARVKANWRGAEQMTREFPEHAVRWIDVFREPTGTSDRSKRVMGLHPNAPLSGRMLWELRATRAGVNDRRVDEVSRMRANRCEFAQSALYESATS